MFYTYVLLCIPEKGKSDFYTGYTSDLRTRIKQHKSKTNKTTRRFEIIKLVYYEACLSEEDARKRELQLKTGFGRGYIKKRLKDYLKTRD
jgi:putative endonuclease